MTTLVAQHSAFGRSVSNGKRRVASLAVATAVLLGALGGIQPASADVLVPNVDAGGAGGTGSSAYIAPTQSQQSIALMESKEALMVSVDAQVPTASGYGPTVS
jgi:hypothetical protein